MKSNSHKNYLPCLLDRLIDHSPHKRFEDENYQTLFSVKNLKDSLIKELANILNAKAKLGRNGLFKYPEVVSSVVNYGIDDTCGKLMGPTELDGLRAMVKTAILAFEPRLQPDTVEVIVKDESLCLESSFSRYSVEIHGFLIGVEQPLEIIVKTALDLEEGQFHVLSEDTK